MSGRSSFSSIKLRGLGLALQALSQVGNLTGLAPPAPALIPCTIKIQNDGGYFSVVGYFCPVGAPTCLREKGGGKPGADCSTT